MTAEHAPDRQNTFDLLRLVAALLVLVSHSYVLSQAPIPGVANRHVEPFAHLTGDTLGAIGVSIFFGLSGFLIAGSWVAAPRFGTFFAKRALRLLPAVIVAGFLTAFVLGPIVTHDTLGTYFTDGRPYAYVLKSSTLFVHGMELPRVFDINELPFEVNGSLWTLPVEAGCYVLAAILGAVALLRRPWALFALAALLVITTTPIVDAGHLLKDLRGNAGVTFDIEIVLRLVAQFVLGMALWSVRDRLALRWWPLALLLVPWIAAWHTSWEGAAAIPLVGYGVLALGHRLPLGLNVLTKPGDVSYGLYIYAFPVQQTVEQLWHPSAGGMSLLAFPITYALAFASWRLVEAPALTLKRRLQGGRQTDPRVPADATPAEAVASAHW